MGGVRYAVRRCGPSACILALVLGSASPVAAQSCHAPPAAETGASALVAAVRSQIASFDTVRYEGHYESVAPSLRLHAPVLDGAIVLPAYRIVRNGSASRGFGDLVLEASAPVLRGKEPADALGLELTTTLPTGDSEHDLGMGHAMLMPALWGSARLRRFSLSGRVGYARALASAGAHHHHAGAFPLVDPMNASELESALAATFEPAHPFALRSGIYGAAPIATQNGAARAAAFVSFGVEGTRMGAAVELHLPLVGDAFSAKLQLESTYRF